jgi:glycosyltransferase involved in cell wall biosynthesis
VNGAQHMMPSVGVVIATHNRPQLMRKALDSVLAQTYPGPLCVVLVFDGTEPESDLAQPVSERPVMVMSNHRTRGLAGARNTGILALDTDLVAFCDDDDVWLPGKLDAQVRRLRERPGSTFVTTAMEVDYAGANRTARLAGTDTVTFDDLARSRMSMLHSSSFVFDRTAMVGEGGFGLVDETTPRSMAEDWDLLLRAARQGVIQHVDEPLVRVLWGQSSYFSDVWADKLAANRWLIEHHPEIEDNRQAWAMMQGKLAFGNAALGHRRTSLRNAVGALRANWHEPRAILALLVVAGVRPAFILRQLNRRGHSI